MTSEETPRQVGRRSIGKGEKELPSKQDLVQSGLLEVEKIRLKKLESLFNEKLPRWRKYPSHRDLYEKQCEHRQELRTILVQIMADKRSLFQKYLQNFFDQIF